MNESHDWKGRLKVAVGRKFPRNVPEDVFAFHREDGSVSTVYGTTSCFLIIDGNKWTTDSIPYHMKPGSLRQVCGETIDRVLGLYKLESIGKCPVSKLRAAVGEPWVTPEPELVKCSECDGYGETTCSHCDSDIDCPDCDGTGKIGTAPDVPQRFVDIAGDPFDALLLAQVLDVVPDEVVTVERGKNHGLPILRINGDGWRVLCSGQYWNNDNDKATKFAVEDAA